MAAEHYKAGRFLSIFHLQTAVLPTTTRCPGLEGHEISTNKNTPNHFQQTKKKSHFTWNLKSKIKGSLSWAWPFPLKQARFLGETGTSPAPWDGTDVSRNQIPPPTQRHTSTGTQSRVEAQAKGITHLLRVCHKGRKLTDKLG